jgi:hypothetical protein
MRRGGRAFCYDSLRRSLGLTADGRVWPIPPVPEPEQPLILPGAGKCAACSCCDKRSSPPLPCSIPISIRLSIAAARQTDDLTRPLPKFYCRVQKVSFGLHDRV